MLTSNEINKRKIIVIICVATLIAGIVGFLTIYIPGDRRYIIAIQIWMITSIFKEFSLPTKTSQDTSWWCLLYSLIKQFVLVIFFGLFAEIIASNANYLVEYAPEFENFIYMAIAATITSGIGLMIVGFVVIFSQSLVLDIRKN